VFKNLGEGINIRNDISPYGYATNTIVCSNTIEGMPSAGIALTMGEIGTRIYDNLISDCNLGMRIHFLNQPGDSNRLVYVYRNCFWLPTNVGDHIFTWSGQTGVTNEYATVWIYHNSFSGGGGVISDNGQAKLNGGLPGFHYLNNIMSGTLYVDPNSWGIGMWTNSAMLGTFDYNEIAPLTATWMSRNPIAAWFGPHNIRNTVAEWPNAQGMSFALAAGSKAIDAALDVSQPFAVGGTNYPALPVDAQTRVGSAWDIGALEHTLQPPNGLRIAN